MPKETKATLASLKGWLGQLELAIESAKAVATGTGPDHERDKAESKVDIFTTLSDAVQDAIDEIEGL